MTVWKWRVCSADRECGHKLPCGLCTYHGILECINRTRAANLTIDCDSCKHRFLCFTDELK